MATRSPKHDFVLTIHDVEKDDPLAPTPFGTRTQSNMTQFYGLGQYYKNAPDYEKYPYSNTTIIVNLHKYNRQAQFRGLSGTPELKAFNEWECAHFQWKERPVYRNKNHQAPTIQIPRNRGSTRVPCEGLKGSRMNVGRVKKERGKVKERTWKGQGKNVEGSRNERGKGQE